MKDNQVIENAIKYIAKLPGFGPRSARRVILHLLKKEGSKISELVSVLSGLKDKISECKLCHNLTEEQVCNICISEKRDKTKICILAEVDDLWSFENSGTFQGVYHILGGSLSAISGVTAENLNLQSLFNRLMVENFEEIIFANNLTIEGATTTFYILEEIYQMQNLGKISKEIKITELANGIPVGASLEYMDENTIKASFSSRKNINSL